MFFLRNYPWYQWFIYFVSFHSDKLNVNMKEDKEISILCYMVHWSLPLAIYSFILFEKCFIKVESFSWDKEKLFQLENMEEFCTGLCMTFLCVFGGVYISIFFIRDIFSSTLIFVISFVEVYIGSSYFEFKNNWLCKLFQYVGIVLFSHFGTYA